MRRFQYVVGCVPAMLTSMWLSGKAAAMDFTITGTVLTPAGIVADGTLAVSGQHIGGVGPASSVPTAPTAIKPADAVILPGFIDLHNHLTWNVLPRWLPGRRFATRYEWQDTSEYDRLLVAPHNVILADAAC